MTRMKPLHGAWQDPPISGDPGPGYLWVLGQTHASHRVSRAPDAEPRRRTGPHAERRRRTGLLASPANPALSPRARVAARVRVLTVAGQSPSCGPVSQLRASLPVAGQSSLCSCSGPCIIRRQQSPISRQLRDCRGLTVAGQSPSPGPRAMDCRKTGSRWPSCRDGPWATLQGRALDDLSGTASRWASDASDPSCPATVNVRTQYQYQTAVSSFSGTFGCVRPVLSPPAAQRPSL